MYKIFKWGTHKQRAQWSNKSTFFNLRSKKKIKIFCLLERLKASALALNSSLIIVSLFLIRILSRSQWLCGLRSAAARLLELWVRVTPKAWVSICCECCVLPGRDLCDELITCPEESYRLVHRCVWSIKLKKKEVMVRVGPQRYRGRNRTVISLSSKIFS